MIGVFDIDNASQSHTVPRSLEIIYRSTLYLLNSEG